MYFLAAYEIYAPAFHLYLIVWFKLFLGFENMTFVCCGYELSEKEFFESKQCNTKQQTNSIEAASDETIQQK